MKYYLGLDNGGTTTKAAIFDIHGNELAVESAATQAHSEKPGFVERDMEEMWQANCRVIRGAVKKAGISPHEVAGIGICGHGKGLYLWGKDNRPVRNGIISTDHRADSYVKLWQEDGTERQAYELSCQHIMPSQPPALLAWLRDNEPDSYANIQWVFECKDYVRFRLTGEARAELTDYSGTSLLNLHTKSYDPMLLSLFGLEAIQDALPPLCDSLAICGYVSADAASACALLPGTPVIGGMFDIDACALGVGITDESRVCMIAGTWSINEYIAKAPVLNKGVKMNSLFCLPGYYLIEESSPTSAANNEWFMRQLLPELKSEMSSRCFYDEINHWVEDISPDEFVPIYLPFIMASNVNPDAKAAFIGLNASHTRRHLLRSVYEGVTFSHRMHFEKLMANRTAAPDCIRLAGGAAHSTVWAQIFADVMQQPVETVRADETGALGCAIGVAFALGDYESIEQACAHMCATASHIVPRTENADIYRKKYELYKSAISQLDPLWSKIQEFSDCK